MKIRIVYPPMVMKDKVVSTDLSQWNHPRRVVALTPLFFVIGWTVGFFLVPHVVESSLTESILNGLLGVVGLLAAIAILALID